MKRVLKALLKEQLVTDEALSTVVADVVGVVNSRPLTRNSDSVMDDEPLPGRGGGVLPSKRLPGMCRYVGSHFHNQTDYNGVTFLACFSRVTRMGSQIFGIFGIRKFW